MRRSTLVSALLGLLCACAGTPKAPIARERPAEVTKLTIPEQSFTQFTVAAELRVPAATATRIEDAQFEISSEGKSLASGTVTLGVDVPAGGGVVEVRASAPYATSETNEVGNGEAPVSILVQGALRGADGTTFPFSHAGRVRVPRAPEVKIWHVEAAAYPEEKEINLVFFVRVENRNPFDIALEQLRYNLSVNGKPLVDDGVSGRKEKIPAASMAQLEIPLTLTAADIDQIESYHDGKQLSYAFDGTLELGVGAMPVALEGQIPVGSGG